MDDPTKSKKIMVGKVMVKKIDKTLPRPSVVDSPNTNVEHMPESLKEMVVSRTDQKPLSPAEVLNYCHGTNYNQNAIEKENTAGPTSARQSVNTPAAQHAFYGQGYVDMCKVVDPEKQPYVPCKGLKQADTNSRATLVGTTPFCNNIVDLPSADKTILPPEYPRQVGAYVVLENGEVYYGGQPIMNGAVRLTGADVVNDKTEYTCEVFIKGEPHQYTVLASEYFSGTWLYNVPLFRLHSQVKISDVRDYLSGLVEFLNKDRVIEHVEKPGWQDVDSKLAYVTPEGVLGTNNHRIISDHGQRFGEMDPRLIGQIGPFLDMVKLTPNSGVAAIIALYTVLGFLREMFKRAGMAPKFILFVLGPSGSQKTSLALAMTQIERTDSPAFTMDATRSGLECGFKVYKDAIMLIDDLAPSEITEIRRKRQNNLEAITRSFGDGTGKKRNNEYLRQGQEISQYEAEGGAIITGEYYAGCASSLARNLVLNLDKGVVDLALLTKIQNITPLGPFMYGFLQWVEQNNTWLIDYIRKQMQEYRSSVQGKYTHARYSEYLAQLLTVADLLAYYGNMTGQLSPAEGTQLRVYFSKQVCQVIEQNSQNAIEHAPITVLCRALVTGVDQHYLPKVTFGMPIENDVHAVLEDETSYYLQQSDILSIKNRYDTAHGISSFAMSANGLAKLLADEGIIKPYKEGRRIRYGKKYFHYGNTRYVKIDKAKLIQQAQY